MGRRKINKRNIRSLIKFAGGRCYGITLPIEIIRKFRWRERQKLELKINTRKKTILIKDWKKQ